MAKAGDTGGAVSVAPSPLPVLWTVPEFAFGDQHGRHISKAVLGQHVWIANFIFTRCTSVCPMMTAKMRALQRKLPSPDLRFVSFSVDPENDTTEALRRYAADWGANETRWHLLRTQPESLHAIVDGMRVVAEPTDDAANPILHTSLFFLIDGQGGVRGLYDSTDERGLRRLIEHVHRLSPPAPAPPEPPGPASSGEAHFVALGCRSCHDNPALAPSLHGIWGKRVLLADGTTAQVDAPYIRESLVAPAAKLVPGYLDTMPSYASELSAHQLDLVVSYVRSLTPTVPAAAGPTAPASLAVDPICGMSVRVTPATPHAEGDGRDHHFCSEACRARFLAARGKPSVAPSAE